MTVHAIFKVHTVPFISVFSYHGKAFNSQMTSMILLPPYCLNYLQKLVEISPLGTKLSKETEG